MFCTTCGLQMSEDAAFCSRCGKATGAPAVPRIVAPHPRLSRPMVDKKIAGVCAGFAEYFDLDVTLVRLVWFFTAFLTGIGLLAYPIAWIVIPEEPVMVSAPMGQRVTSS